jgi:hypothetical protein
MADDNPDSVVLELLAAIEERNAKLAFATDIARRQSALIDKLTADNETLREEAKHFNRLASEARRKLAEYEVTACGEKWKPVNDWVN